MNITPDSPPQSKFLRASKTTGAANASDAMPNIRCALMGKEEKLLHKERYKIYKLHAIVVLLEFLILDEITRRFFMKIAMGCDHAGFETKCAVKKFVMDKGHEVQDFGTNSADAVDYPDFIYPAALAVSEGRADRAILIDCAGYPSAAIANMLYGVSAAVCFDTVCASLARQHSNTNVLCLGGKLIGTLLAAEIARVWLETDFLGGKYAARLEKVRQIEARHLRLPNMTARKVVALQDLKDVFTNRESLILDENTIITPSVLDAIKNLR